MVPGNWRNQQRSAGSGSWAGLLHDTLEGNNGVIGKDRPRVGCETSVDVGNRVVVKLTVRSRTETVSGRDA